MFGTNLSCQLNNRFELKFIIVIYEPRLIDLLAAMIYFELCLEVFKCIFSKPMIDLWRHMIKLKNKLC